MLNLIRKQETLINVSVTDNGELVTSCDMNMLKNLNKPQRRNIVAFINEITKDIGGK